MTMQMSMFDLFEPPRAPVQVKAYTPPPTHQVMTRAYGKGYEMRVQDGEPDPYEIEVRGIPCLITFGVGFSTYTVQPAGSLFWSSTGFRSFAGAMMGANLRFNGDFEHIPAYVESYLDTPESKSGCGGKLVRWWPLYVSRWQQDVEWDLSYPDRSKVWMQWGPDRHAELWAQHDTRKAEAMRQMLADGIDPNETGKPQGFKGKWPRFDTTEIAA